MYRHTNPRKLDQFIIGLGHFDFCKESKNVDTLFKMAQVKGLIKTLENHKNSSLWCKIFNNLEKWKATGNQKQITYKITAVIFGQDLNCVSF